VQRLEKHGITVLSLQPGTIEEMYVYWEILGILTGKHTEAAHMIRRFRKGVADFQSLIRGITPRKKVYFEAIHSKMKTFSPDFMTMFVLKTAGGVNVAEDAVPVRNTNIAAYGKERILSHAEEIEVYLAQSGVMNRPTMSLIQNEAGFGIIRAVKENQIYFIDEMIVSRPTMRLLMGIYEIGKAIYPGVFTADRMPAME
jgi:iron complex transport system substrate-binding protein